MPSAVKSERPLHVFINNETGVQTRVWASRLPDRYNVTLYDMDAEQTFPEARVGMELGPAIALARKWADLADGE